MNTNYNTIDEYLALVSEEKKRAALEKLRTQIKTIVPDAEECISYQLPAFRLNGRALVGFGTAQKHCAFYPWSGSTVKEFSDELKGFDTSKGTIRFQPDKPLPVTLLRKIIKARLVENENRTKRAKGK